MRAFSSHWQELANFVPKSKRGEMLSKGFEVGKRVSKAENVSPVDEINWDEYEAVLGKDVVGPMKAEYDATPVSNLDAEIESSVKASKAKMDALKAHVDEIDERNKPVKEAAAKQLEILERSRTTENTTLEEVMRRYPHVYKTVMKQIDDENYNTQYPAIDESAIRLATIKAKWDSAKDGKLTEDKLNEVVSDMDSYTIPKAQQYGDYTYADFTDEEKASVARAHEALGVELTDELIAEYESTPDPFSLTEAELAETDEGVLRQTMHNVVVGDGPIDRAILLHDRIEKLRETGQLVPNPDVVERIEQSLGDNSIVRMTEDEFEGKSAEELTKLSQEAAASGDYYRASMFLYEAKVLEGEIDPSVRGGESYSATCNLMMQMSDNLITVQETGKRPQFGLLF